MALLAYVQSQMPEIQGVSSGAIASDYQRLRVEHVHHLSLYILEMPPFARIHFPRGQTRKLPCLCHLLPLALQAAQALRKRLPPLRFSEPLM